MKGEHRMAKFKHTQNLSGIEFDKTLTMYCPLGRDYYTATVSVNFIPGEWVMDYLDVEDFFKKTQGEHLIIEDLVNKVYGYLKDNYAPANLAVAVHAENATHFPVTVYKQD